jgi:hypothetical protein
MKKIISTLVLILIFNWGYSQAYVKGGAVIQTHPRMGVGSDLNIGIRLKENTVSIGYLHNVVRDNTLFNLRYGRILYSKFTLSAGIGYADWSTDDRTRGYYTGVFGLEYFTHELVRKGRVYYGIDFSQNKIFLKSGIAFNF